jgi:hypothetical protein
MAGLSKECCRCKTESFVKLSVTVAKLTHFYGPRSKATLWTIPARTRRNRFTFINASTNTAKQGQQLTNLFQFYRKSNLEGGMFCQLSCGNPYVLSEGLVAGSSDHRGEFVTFPAAPII